MAEREKVIRGLEVCTTDFCSEECPYYQCDGRSCHNPLMRDALFLLKEQEPRVMTLEELQDIETPWNRNTPPYLWVEGRSARESRWMSWGFMHDLVRLPGTMGVQNYGSAWRVWTLQPTEEQRKAVLWDD